MEQQPNQIVDIADWQPHGDYEVYPVGARVKSLRVCPDPAPYEFCRPDHRYLFKEAMKSVKNPGQPRYPDQYWSEIIAFKIGTLMALPVPPTYVAFDSDTGEPGALIEWFMGYDQTFVPGGDFMQSLIDGYDRHKGEEHNIGTITALCRGLTRGRRLQGDWECYWGLCLCFDAIIGNTDRHQENWGLVHSSERKTFDLSPYFDNGTSLGHELDSRKMAHYMTDPNGLAAYINRGTHHVKWRKDGAKLKLFEGVVQYCKRFPRVLQSVLKSLDWEDAELERCLSRLTLFAIQSPLSVERARFVYKLTTERKRRLLDLLGSL